MTRGEFKAIEAAEAEAACRREADACHRAERGEVLRRRAQRPSGPTLRRPSAIDVPVWALLSDVMGESLLVRMR